MTKNRYQMKFGEILFCLGYTIFIVTSLLDLTGVSYIIGSSPKEPTALNSVIRYLRYFSYIILLTKIVCTAKRKKILFFVFPLVFALFALSYYYSTNIELLFYLLIIVSAEKIDSKKIFKIIMYSQIIILTMTVLLSSMGILYDLVIDPGYRDRHYLGFLYTTTSADLLFFIILEYIYLHEGIMKRTATVVFFMGTVALMILTDTRLTFLLSIITIVYFGFFYKRRTKKRLFPEAERFLLLVPSLICTSSLMMYIGFSPASMGWRAVDKLLSYRFTYSYRAIMEYGFKLFGQPIEFISQYNFVDSSYLQIALEFGIIAIAIVVCIYTVVIRRAIKLNKKYLIDILLLVMLLSVTQTRLFTFSYNAFPLLLYSIIDGQSENQSYRRLKMKEAISA